MRFGHLHIILSVCFSVSLMFCSEHPDVTNAWQKLPKPSLSRGADPSSQALTDERDAIFDKLSGNHSPLDKEAPRIQHGGASRDMAGFEDEFPFALSDTVAVATFTDYAPRLTTSHRSIYSNITLLVNKVVVPGPKQIAENDYITILELGGSVLLPSGKALAFATADRPFTLQPGHRYLLFLRYESAGQYFSVTKSWDLSSGVLIPNSPDDYIRKQRGTSKHAGMSEAEGVDDALKAGKGVTTK